MISCDLECMKKSCIATPLEMSIYNMTQEYTHNNQNTHTNIAKQNRITRDTIWLTHLSHYSLPAAAASACAALFCAEHDPWNTSTGPENACRFGAGMETVEAEVDQ